MRTLEGQQQEREQLQRDFRRFQESGDAAAMARVFDVLAARLLLVAAHVTRDGSQAEDLVQTTFLVAMRDAKGWDSSRPLLPWMLGILSKRGVDLHRRSELRRTQALGNESEGAAHFTESNTSLDPADLAADSELREEIAAAIDALSDPYREVLILRVAHGLNAVDIGHALGRSPETVRVQLQRGRERLKSALPRGLALPSMFLVDTESNLAGVREAILGKAAQRAATLGSTAALTGAPALLAGIMTMKGLSLGIVVALLIYGGWALLQKEPVGQGNPGVEARARVAEPDALDEAPDLAVQLEATGKAQLPDRSQASTPATKPLLVHVTYASDGLPASDVGVTLRRLGGTGMGRESRTDSMGLATFASLDPGSYMLEHDRGVTTGRRVSLPLTDPHGNPVDKRIEVQIPRGRTVQGLVQDLEGNGVAGADVFRVSVNHHDRQQRLASTDESGAFSLRDIANGTEMFARSAGFQPSRTGGRSFVGVAEWEDADQVEVILELGAIGNQLSGSVRDRAGNPIPHALIAIAVDEDARDQLQGLPSRDRTRAEGKPPELEAFLVRADADGMYFSNEVPSGSASLFARPPEEDARIGWATIEISLGREYSLDLVVDQGAAIFGRVLDELGQPAPELEISVDWEGNNDIGQTEYLMGSLLTDRMIRSDSDGNYRLTGLLPGDYDARVPGALGESRFKAEFVLAAGEIREWNPVISARKGLAIQLQDLAGTPLADWAVRLSATAEHRLDGAQQVLPTNPDGRVRFENLAQRSYRLEVFRDLQVATRSEKTQAALTLEQVFPGEEELVIPVPSAATTPSPGD